MKGPAFLKKPKEEWPTEKLDFRKAGDPQLKNAKHKPVGAIVQNQDILKSSTFSSWQRLLRVTVYCIRFLSNAKKKKDTRLPVTKYAKDLWSQRRWIKQNATG